MVMYLLTITKQPGHKHIHTSIIYITYNNIHV